jgi:hypothetical protein
VIVFDIFNHVILGVSLSVELMRPAAEGEGSAKCFADPDAKINPLDAPGQIAKV